LPTNLFDIEKGWKPKGKRLTDNPFGFNQPSIFLNVLELLGTCSSKYLETIRSALILSLKTSHD